MKLLKTLLISLIVAAITTACSISGVQAGDKPKLNFTAFGSQKPVNLTDYKGKIVVVDFWATWCPPCMAEAGHLVTVNEKYAPKGVQFLGISLDSDPQILAQVIKDKNFTWPMSFEGKGWEGSIPQAWGVDAIPETFIIGPDGAVLWRGDPSEIEEPLEKAVEEHAVQVQ